MDERIGFGLYQSCGNRMSVGRVSLLQWCGWYMWGVGWCLDQGLEGWCFVCVRVVSPDSLCRWQVHESVYCAGLIHVHLMCTKCSIMLHLIDICFLTCILFMVDIENPALFLCGCRTWVYLDITLIYEEQRQPSSVFLIIA